MPSRCVIHRSGLGRGASIHDFTLGYPQCFEHGVSGISIGGADAGNYTFNSSTATTADVGTRPVQVTADRRRLRRLMTVPIPSHRVRQWMAGAHRDRPGADAGSIVTWI